MPEPPTTVTGIVLFLVHTIPAQISVNNFCKLGCIAYEDDIHIPEIISVKIRIHFRMLWNAKRSRAYMYRTSFSALNVTIISNNNMIIDSHNGYMTAPKQNVSSQWLLHKMAVT